MLHVHPDLYPRRAHQIIDPYFQIKSTAIYYHIMHHPAVALHIAILKHSYRDDSSPTPEWQNQLQTPQTTRSIRTSARPHKPRAAHYQLHPNRSIVIFRQPHLSPLTSPTNASPPCPASLPAITRPHLQSSLPNPAAKSPAASAPRQPAQRRLHHRRPCPKRGSSIGAP